MKLLSESSHRVPPVDHSKRRTTPAWALLIALPLAANGCGGDEENPDRGVTGTGGTNAAGTGTGGTGTGGGVPNAGGTSPGTGGTCSGGQPTAPQGIPFMCTGALCPYGQCSELQIGGDPACSSVYPAPISGTSGLCGASANGGYCLVSGTALCRRDWAVSCANGAASLELCAATARCTASSGFPAVCQ